MVGETACIVCVCVYAWGEDVVNTDLYLMDTSQFKV